MKITCLDCARFKFSYSDQAYLEFCIIECSKDVQKTPEDMNKDDFKKLISKALSCNLYEEE